jgi:hypothetical protein
MDKRYKLSDEDVQMIFQLDTERHAMRERMKSLTVDAICAKFEISHSYYYYLLNGTNRSGISLTS